MDFCELEKYVLPLKDLDYESLFFLFCLALLFHKEVHIQKTQEEQDSKLIGLVKKLKRILLHTISAMQGQTICLISVFTSEMLFLSSCWSKAEISSFLYQRSACLAVILVHDELILVCLESSAKCFYIYGNP